jgi:methylated-DNA-[protein]-cysteine S-methyltransferase
MIAVGMGWRVMGRGYAIFDSAIGRCGIVWSDFGIVGVQLPELREIDTRRRLYKLYPNARELPPSAKAKIAIARIVALLRGESTDSSDVALDMAGIPAFSQRVYEYVRNNIPRGETRTYDDIATSLRMPGALDPVMQAIGKNPFMIIVPCHRVLKAGHDADDISPHGGTISKRHLLSLEGTRTGASKTLFDALLPVAPPRAHP